MTFYPLTVKRIVQARERSFKVYVEEPQRWFPWLRVPQFLWMPKSLVANSEAFCGGEWEVTLHVEEWIAEKWRERQREEDEAYAAANQPITEE